MSQQPPLNRTASEQSTIQEKMPREDWDFRKCPEDEVADCARYEFTRASKIGNSVILRAAAAVKKNPRILLKAKQQGPKVWADKFGDDELELLFWNDWIVHSFWDLFPKPWLLISGETRKQRLAAFYGEFPIGEFPITTSAIAAGSPVPLVDAKSGKFQTMVTEVDPEGIISYSRAVLCVRWWFSDKQLLAAFEHWLAKNRPPNCKPDEKRGRTSWRDFLKCLAAHRLLEQHSWSDAATLTEEVTGKELYSDQPSWLHARASFKKLMGIFERTGNLPLGTSLSSL